MGYEPDVQEAKNSTLDFVRMLCMGFSGGGKTTLAATAKDPLILLLEPQGLISIKAIAPDASVIVVDGKHMNPETGERVPIIDPNTGEAIFAWDHLMRTLAWVKRNIGTEAFPWSTLCVDSFQDAMWVFMYKLLRGKGVDDPDNPPRLTQGEYGTLGDRALDMIRFLKALPIDLIVTTKAEEYVDGEELKVRPGGIGKIAPENVAYHFNLVVYTYKHLVTEGSRPDYLVLTDGHDKYITKGHAALDPVEIQNADYMFARIKGSPGTGLIKPGTPRDEGVLPTPPEPHEPRKPSEARRDAAEEAKKPKGKGKKPPLPKKKNTPAGKGN